MTRRASGVWLALAVAVLLGACTSSGPVVTETRPFVALSKPLRVRAIGLLLRNRDVAVLPKLCTGGIYQSLPPQCEGRPVKGVDIERLAGVQHRGSIWWGGAEVLGILRNGIITATEPARRPDPRPVAVRRPPKCVPTRRGPYRPLTRPQRLAVERFVKSTFPGEYQLRYGAGSHRPTPLGFVGSPRRLRSIGRGLEREFPKLGLCVARFRRPLADYERAYAQLLAAQDHLARRGVRLSSGGTSLDSVDMSVEIADPATLRYLRHRFPLVQFTSEIEVLGPA